MPTIEEVLAYLGYDEADDMVKNNVERSIKTADAYLKGSIAENYPAEDPRIKELALMVIGNLYDTRGLIEKVAGNVRRLWDDMSLQIKLELSRNASNSEEV